VSTTASVIVGLPQMSRDVSMAIQHVPDINMVDFLDVEDQV